LAPVDRLSLSIHCHSGVTLGFVLMPSMEVDENSRVGRKAFRGGATLMKRLHWTMERVEGGRNEGRKE
jgi:hypothetical protein